MDYVGHNGLLWPAKDPLWWKLGPPGKSGVAFAPPPPNGASEAILITVIKYGSEAWPLRRTEEEWLNVFQRNCLQIVLGTRLTDGI